MHGAQILVPITLFIAGFAMIFGIVYLKTRENLALMEKGWNPKEYNNRPAPYRSLKAGLLFLGAGLGLLIAYFIDAYTEHPREIEPVYMALLAIGGGLGLIGSYAVEKKELMNRREP
ncbi:MAG TPA: DUF6249 domain-containing protein [Chitinophagaceae bacterium]|jgi:hypothetical protein|nr:DUF6249 domain-containing protein [Chitinophagaceae bacterium]